jgi:hypothetical protein
MTRPIKNRRLSSNMSTTTTNTTTPESFVFPTRDELAEFMQAFDRNVFGQDYAFVFHDGHNEIFLCEVTNAAPDGTPIRVKPLPFN